MSSAVLCTADSVQPEKEISAFVGLRMEVESTKLRDASKTSRVLKDFLHVKVKRI